MMQCVQIVTQRMKMMQFDLEDAVGDVAKDAAADVAAGHVAENAE